MTCGFCVSFENSPHLFDDASQELHQFRCLHPDIERDIDVFQRDCNVSWLTAKICCEIRPIESFGNPLQHSVRNTISYSTLVQPLLIQEAKCELLCFIMIPLRKSVAAWPRRQVISKVKGINEPSDIDVRTSR